MKTQFTVAFPKSSKPRNPWVVAAKFRSAGSHQAGTGAMRQGARKSLKRELDQLERFFEPSKPT